MSVVWIAAGNEPSNVRNAASLWRRSANSAARIRARSAAANTSVWAARMRSARGTLASANCPASKVVDQKTASATINIAAAANAGRQRTAIHKRTGSTKATGRAVAHGLCGREMTKILSTARVASPTIPSISSRRGGSSRTVSARPIRRGATVKMPSEQDANHSRHACVEDVAGSRTHKRKSAQPSV